MKMTRQAKSVSSISIGTLILIAVLLLVWELSSALSLISRLFFPPPSVILKTFYELLLDGRLLKNTSATLMRICLGSLMGIVPGVLMGVLMGWSKRLRTLFDPLIAALHPIPKIAIFPLILIIFGIGEMSNIVVIAISAFFPALVNSMTGVGQLDPVYFEVARNYGANRWKTFSRILIPGSLPSILSGVRLGLNTGLLIAIAVELISAKSGLGVMVWFSWQTLRVEELYASLIVVAGLGILINVGLKALSNWLAPWNADQIQYTLDTQKSRHSWPASH